MSDRPSFQFYPGDWQLNANLKRCSHAEKGVWVDILCLLHDSEEYGVLRWSLPELAKAIGCRPGVIQGLLQKSVLKGAVDETQSVSLVYQPTHARTKGEPVVLIPEQKGPIFFSSRMVTDEYKRKNSGLSTRFKASPPSSPSPRQGENKGDICGDGSSSSSSSSLKNIYTGGGQEAGVGLPRRYPVPDPGWSPHPTIVARLHMAGAPKHAREDVDLFIAHYTANNYPPSYMGNLDDLFLHWMLRKKSFGSTPKASAAGATTRQKSASKIAAETIESWGKDEDHQT